MHLFPSEPWAVCAFLEALPLCIYAGLSLCSLKPVSTHLFTSGTWAPYTFFLLHLELYPFFPSEGAWAAYTFFLKLELCALYFSCNFNLNCTFVCLVEKFELCKPFPSETWAVYAFSFCILSCIHVLLSGEDWGVYNGLSFFRRKQGSSFRRYCSSVRSKKRQRIDSCITVLGSEVESTYLYIYI